MEVAVLEVLDPKEEVPIASCGPPRVHSPLIKVSRDEDKDSNENCLITDEEKQLIRHLEDTGVPRQLTELRMKLWDVGLM
jgi:hypothetical protein